MEDEERKGGCPWHVPSAGVYKGLLLVSSQDPSYRIILASFQSNGRDIGSDIGSTTLGLSLICDQPSQNYILMQSE